MVSKLEEVKQNDLLMSLFFFILLLIILISLVEALYSDGRHLLIVLYSHREPEVFRHVFAITTTMV